MDEETYSVDTQDVLAFSQDTVTFDTVISGVATQTYTFQVFNRCDKALRIRHIELEQGAQSPFVVNVDGTAITGGSTTGDEMTGTSADFAVGAGDSLRVFLQLMPPVTDKDAPQELQDKLNFTLESGVMQSVVLTAASQDVNRLQGVIISENTEFASVRPYQIIDSLVVAEGARLTIKAGTRLYFHAGASLIVRGRLLAEGRQDAPVVFRGDRLGNMFDGQPYDRIPGQWGGIVFTAESLGNDLTWCDIHSGTWGIRCEAESDAKQQLIIDNSIIHNCSRDAFQGIMSNAFVGNCQITNAGGDCVALAGGSYTFVHCTIGQFYAFTGGRGVALSFTNTFDDAPLPLNRLQVVNTLVSGYNDDDVMGSASERYVDCAFNFAFKNCLLNTPRILDSPSIVDCLFEDGKDYDYEAQQDSTIHAGNFSPRFDLDALVFPFTLDPKSRAVDAADAELTRQSGYTTDLAGRSRTADGKPDIGAYEAVKPE